ncbi:MAG: transcription termination/antitermination NusG family protein [Bacillota bacterium]
MYWCAVKAKPQKEDFAASQLQHKGFEIFLPKIEVTRKRGSKSLKLLEPLFPGYLFVRLLLEPLVIQQVNWTPGVKYLICAGNTPVPVPEEAITLIRQRLNPQGYIVPGIQAQFPPGTRIAVRFGPFAGLVGIVERPAAKQSRVRVLLKLLQRQIPIELEAVHLERLEPAPGE